MSTTLHELVGAGDLMIEVAGAFHSRDMMERLIKPFVRELLASDLFELWASDDDEDLNEVCKLTRRCERQISALLPDDWFVSVAIYEDEGLINIAIENTACSDNGYLFVLEFDEDGRLVH